MFNDSKIAMFGTVDEVYSRGKELKEIGLNVPEVTEAFIKLHDMGIDCRTDIYTVEQGIEEFARLKSQKEELQ